MAASEVAPLLLSVEAAGEALNVRRTTAWSLVLSGQLKSVKIGSRRLVPVKEIERYVETLSASVEGA